MHLTETELSRMQRTLDRLKLQHSIAWALWWALVGSAVTLAAMAV